MGVGCVASDRLNPSSTSDRRVRPDIPSLPDRTCGLGGAWETREDAQSYDMRAVSAHVDDEGVAMAVGEEGEKLGDVGDADHSQVAESFATV